VVFPTSMLDLRIIACAVSVLVCAACRTPEVTVAPRQTADAAYHSFASIDATRRWIEQHPDDHEALLELAQQLMSPETAIADRDFREALLVARQSVQLNQTPGCEYYATLGTALYLNGDHGAARTAYLAAASAARDSDTRAALASWANELGT